jgi:hypothetical protein
MAKTIYKLDFTISTTVRVYVHDDENANYQHVIAEGEALAYEAMTRMNQDSFDFDLVGEDTEQDFDDFDGPDRTEYE